MQPLLTNYFNYMKTAEIKTRIEPNTRKRLETEAKKQGRTLSNLLQMIVNDWLRRKK